MHMVYNACYFCLIREQMFVFCVVNYTMNVSMNFKLRAKISPIVAVIFGNFTWISYVVDKAA